MRKGIAGCIIILAVLSASLAVADGGSVDMSKRLESPSLVHLCGTDTFGRDLAGRLGSGVITSFLIASSATALSLAAGIALSYAFFLRQHPSSLLMTLLFSLKAVPTILLALFLNAVSGPGVMKLIIVLAAGHAADIAETAHSRISVLRNEDFITASLSSGQGMVHVFVFHILPNALRPLLLQGVSIFSASILTEASLSFLGCGVPVTVPSIGSILAEARPVMLNAPWMVLFPSLLLLLAGFALELIVSSLSETDSPAQ